MIMIIELVFLVVYAVIFFFGGLVIIAVPLFACISILNEYSQLKRAILNISDSLTDIKNMTTNNPINNPINNPTNNPTDNNICREIAKKL